jgi:hypothetical protein
VRRRRGAKKRSQDSIGSRQKSAAARKRVIRRAVPAVRKGHLRKGPGKDRTKRRAPKGRRLENLRRRGQECNIGVKPTPKEPATSADAEDIRKELQEAYTTGEEEANIRVYEWATQSE